MEEAERKNPVEGKEELFLTFRLANEAYCVSIVKIKKIIEMSPITCIPQAPDFLKGVINQRGKVIPVIDLRLRFGVKMARCSDGACIMVAEIEGDSGSVTVGLVVDSVLDVLKIESENVEEVPEFHTMTNSNYILGLTKMDRDVKILIDINKVLNFDELSVLETIAKSNSYFLENGNNFSSIQGNTRSIHRHCASNNLRI